MKQKCNVCKALEIVDEACKQWLLQPQTVQHSAKGERIKREGMKWNKYEEISGPLKWVFPWSGAYSNMNTLGEKESTRVLMENRFRSFTHCWLQA